MLVFVHPTIYVMFGVRCRMAIVSVVEAGQACLPQINLGRARMGERLYGDLLGSLMGLWIISSLFLV
jgi:hypothetical protein